MKSSKRASSTRPARKPANAEQESNLRIADIDEETTIKTLVRVEPEVAEPVVVPPAPVEPAPPANVITYPIEITAPTTPPMMEPPLYQRNPGPPPRAPRRIDPLGKSRTSYRYTEVKFGAPDLRALLWVCATIGIVLLYLLFVLKPQSRPIDQPIMGGILASQVGNSVVDVTPTQEVSIDPVPPAEQFGIVMKDGAFVLEEPRDQATRLQSMSQYTLLAFQRKSSDGWFQLKGGSGWIKAANLSLYADEQSAWVAKKILENK